MNFRIILDHTQAWITVHPFFHGTYPLANATSILLLCLIRAVDCVRVNAENLPVDAAGLAGLAENASTSIFHLKPGTVVGTQSPLPDATDIRIDQADLMISTGHGLIPWTIATHWASAVVNKAPGLDPSMTRRDIAVWLAAVAMAARLTQRSAASTLAEFSMRLEAARLALLSAIDRSCDRAPELDWAITLSHGLCWIDMKHPHGRIHVRGQSHRVLKAAGPKLLGPVHSLAESIEAISLDNLCSAKRVLSIALGCEAESELEQLTSHDKIEAFDSAGLLAAAADRLIDAALQVPIETAIDVAGLVTAPRGEVTAHSYPIKMFAAQ